jgi:hypothetical protein
MKHVRRTHAIELDLPPEEAFPLFTPAGEKLWIREWNPAFIHPASGETQAGMVFTTGTGDEATYWSLVDYDPRGLRARYARVTPASRFGFVEVHCSALGARRTRVEVSYAFTALTPAGEAFLDGFGEDAFRAMIEGWRGLIEDWQRRQG